MTDYLLSIVGIVLISTILTNVLPPGKSATLIKNIVRLCLYLVILSPAYHFFQNELSNGEKNFFQNYFSENVIQTDRDYIDYCSEKSIGETQRLLAQKLKEDYGIDADVLIIIETDTSLSTSQKIDGIRITSGELTEKIKREIERDFLNEFKVTVEFIEKSASVGG